MILPNIAHIDILERLQACEDAISDGFRIIALNLRQIHDDKLYLATHNTWQEYLSERWGKSGSWYKRIKLDADTAQYVYDVTAQWHDTGVIDAPIELTTASHARTLKTFDTRLQPAIALLAHNEAQRRATTLTGGIIRECGDVLTRAINDGVVSINGDDIPALAVATNEALDELQARQAMHRNDGYFMTRIETRADDSGRITIDDPALANRDVMVIVKYRE